MRAVTERWGVFQGALGAKLYILADLAKLAVAIAAFAYLYFFGRDMTLVAKITTRAAIVFFILFWLMFEYALKLTRQISDSRVRLSELRHEGVRLRNHARTSVTDTDAWKEWQGKANSVEG